MWLTRARRVAVAVVMASACLLVGDTASWADTPSSVACRDASSAELGSRPGGTTCTWVPSASPACTSYDVTVAGPVLLGMSGPQWSTNTTSALVTVFHPVIPLSAGYRLVVQVVCVVTGGVPATTTRYPPFVFGYDVGRCPTSSTCSTLARAGILVAIGNLADPLPVRETTPQPYPTYPPVVVPTPTVYLSAAPVLMPGCPATPSSLSSPSPSPSPSPSATAGTRGVDCPLLASVDAATVNPVLFGLSILVVLAVASFIYRHGTPLRGLRRWSR